MLARPNSGPDNLERGRQEYCGQGRETHRHILGQYFIRSNNTLVCAGTGYTYTRDLVDFQRRVPLTTCGKLPEYARFVNTLLKRAEFAVLFQEHPDCQFREYIPEGIQCGFSVSLEYRHSCKSAKKNRFTQRWWWADTWQRS